MATSKITLPHKCPQCGKEAITYQEVDEKFGFRNMDKESMRNQSWCRDCRKKS
ncbi:MAG: hypothetical protein Q9M36_01270 [Sulfurovum sp.]|nr:hypothetical protein [Sulfurovum sp.]